MTALRRGQHDFEKFIPPAFIGWVIFNLLNRANFRPA
jgi:hypothetical protein